MQALSVNGEWGNSLSICFKSIKMSDRSVWAFERNIEFTDRLYWVLSRGKCLSKEHVYFIIHSSLFVRG